MTITSFLPTQISCSDKTKQKMLYLFAAAFLLLVSTAAVRADDPISCLAVNYNGYFNDNDQFNLNISGSFALSVSNGTTFVTATNISIFNAITNEQATGVCYYGICCNITTTNSCTFDVRDTYVLLYANFSNGISMTTFTGLIADDGTFGTTKLFTNNQTCLIANSSENETSTGHNICCTSSVPAPVASASSPRCKRFTSRTTIYNTDDNFSIFATASLTYDIVGRTIVPSNLTDQPAPNYFVCIFDHTFFNNPLSCDNLNIVVYSNVTMDQGDTKFLISTFYLPYSTIFGINGILSARLLYRNGNLLMREGVPFTPQNNCLYLTAPWYPHPENHSTAANFCCTDFES